MARFGLGLLAGIVIGGARGAGGLYLALTREVAPASVAPASGPATPAKQGGKKRRPAGAVAAGVTEGVDDEPIQLGPADLRVTAEGDALRAGATQLDLGSAEGPRDLAQDEIDAAIARR